MSFTRLLLVACAVAPSFGGPCCQGCELPKVKVFSTDAKHGYCGEGCMNPAHFSFFHHFESNLTLATDDHPCREQWTPDNKKQYTDYTATVTHGAGPLSFTLDLYEPTDMPSHACCFAQIVHPLGCPGFMGKPDPVLIDGTGPFCCPEGATPTEPCSNETLPIASPVMV
mmetsp:Transcript_6129/g.11238  ORF Transcript_6129/g.11238 Transcript_6129/m.11238 type:complete len:169 (+) Transcript_6129:54-560(+)